MLLSKNRRIFATELNRPGRSRPLLPTRFRAEKTMVQNASSVCLTARIHACFMANTSLILYMPIALVRVGRKTE